jgi:hypothetical protein
MCNRLTPPERIRKLSACAGEMDHCPWRLQVVSMQAAVQRIGLQSAVGAPRPRAFVFLPSVISRHSSQTHDGDANKRHVVRSLELVMMELASECLQLEGSRVMKP